VPGTLVVETEEFRVEVADACDASEVQTLYAEYVGAHLRCYSDQIGTQDASFEDWSKALCAISFDEVLSDIKASRAVAQQTLRATEPPAVAANKAAPKSRPLAGPVPGVLKCTQRGAAECAQPVVGYLLYELREKGEKKKRQRFCEIVNLVVSSSHRGLGAGNLLMKGLLDHLGLAAMPHAQDLRLFVAAENKVPRAWYSRMGFREAGFQPEKVNGETVGFIRMIRNSRIGSGTNPAEREPVCIAQ